MTDQELQFKAQDLMLTLEVVVGCAIENLNLDLGIFKNASDGRAVCNQDFPLIAARADFIRDCIRYNMAELKQAEEIANEILEVWNSR